MYFYREILFIGSNGFVKDGQARNGTLRTGASQ